MVPLPTGWGRDPLTAYFDNFRHNQFATFSNKRSPVVDLIKIDEMFKSFLDGAINPKPFFPMGFILRAHAAYRAGAGAVMAGQLYEANALFRLCLEHGAYAFYIGEDAERWRRWINRHDTASSKKNVREEFAFGKIANHIQATSQVLSGQFRKLYEQSIDFGADPNEQGFSASLSIRRGVDRTHYDTIYLHGDGLPLDFGLKMTGQVGLWVLHVAQLIYPARFEILGIRSQLEEIRKRY